MRETIQGMRVTQKWGMKIEMAVRKDRMTRIQAT